MRMLVGAACIAIIAFVGHSFWNEWSAYRAARLEAQQLAQAKEDSRALLYERFSSDPDPEKRIHAYCENVANGWVSASDPEAIVARCRLAGFWR